jgi:erythromycin esterase-like protein
VEIPRRDWTPRVPGAGSEQFDELLPQIVEAHAEPFEDLEEVAVDGLLDRIADARVVCLGEASHGTSEFYRMRQRITRALIERKGFEFVAMEADWPDARRIDSYVRDLDVPLEHWKAFVRFPTWMWRNAQVRAFVEWLREHNAAQSSREERVGLHGLDLYSLHTSIDRILAYLESVDRGAAALARERYACLMPWQGDPGAYGLAAARGRYEDCEQQVVAMLSDLLDKRLEYEARADEERFFDAASNARLVANAERYYRTMYRGPAASWNLRDQHMFDTLSVLLRRYGPRSKGVIWAHNSHVGDASATQMAARGEYNVGQLCRERFGTDAFLLGFGTDRGTVAAASDWGGPMQVMQLRHSDPRSYEHVFHRSELPAFFLPLSGRTLARDMLMPPRLERAVGVIYRPETELASHYFEAMMPRQFDEIIWFDETTAVTPLDAVGLEDMPETYPFGL